MTASTVIVIAKEPVPGRVKTRLQQRFSPDQAAQLATAALVDTFTAVDAADVLRRVVALEGRPGAWLPDDVEVTGQGEGGLDVRLDHVFEQVFASQVLEPAPRRALLGIGPTGPAGLLPRPRAVAGPVLLIGMDTPQVTAELLDTDWGGADAVLGLSLDGGFWAVGFREYVPGAFIGVPMSTDHTGADQLDRLRSLGLTVRLLPSLRDVDTPADAASVAACAPGTRFAKTYRRLTAPVAAVRREHPLELFAAALGGTPVLAELPDGQRIPLDVGRWNSHPDGADLMLLSRCEGAVLDLGCGPGRLVGALAAAGTAALGVDICPSAVKLTADRGASVLKRSVHDRLPAEGRWGTVLLADGNIGIGGDPDGLLQRCATLLQPMGLLLAEADPDEALDTREQLCLVAGQRRSYPMPWARLGCTALAEAARRTGFLVVEEWRAGGRVFLALRSPGTAVAAG